MDTTKYDMIIIGGGISGLTLAYLLADMDQNVLVLDKTERTGGAIESLSYDGFSIDLGAHTAYNSYTTLLEMVAQSSAKQQLQVRTKQKYYFATPKGFRKLTQPLRFGELLLHLPKVFKASKEGKSVKEYYSKILGNSNYHNFARHFFKAVLCQNADSYPAGFFLKRRDHRNKEYPRSFTFTEGMQTFANAVQQHSKINIKANVQIANIAQNDFWEVETSQGTFQSRKLAFACYANEAATLIQNIAPELSILLAKISYQTVSSFGIIIKKESVKDLKEFAGLLTTTDDYTSIVSRDIAPHEKHRGFTIHAQGKVSTETLRKTLCEVLKIDDTSILEEKYKNNYLPKLEKGHEDFLAELGETVAQQTFIYVTGNYFQGLSLEDCVQRSKEEALRYISTAE